MQIRPKIYRENKKLDIDRDGIACEDEGLQQILSAPPPTTSTTTTTTTIPTTPVAPSGLTLTIKSPFDGTGVLSWTDNSNNEENFYISNVDPATLSGVPLSSIWYKASRNQISVTITGYLNGYTYCYWAMASNLIGNSAWSAPACSLAGTATTTTTAYVPPSTAYISPSSGSASTSYSSYSISGYVGSSNVSLTSSWSSLFQRYSISGYVGSSYVSLTSSWSSLFQRYSISGYIDSSYVSLTSSWSGLFQRYSISGYVDNSYVSATSSWSSLFQRYSMSGTGTSREAAILAAVIVPPR